LANINYNNNYSHYRNPQQQPL